MSCLYDTCMHGGVTQCLGFTTHACTNTQALKECVAQAPLLSGLLTETLPELEANNQLVQFITAQ